MGLWQKMKEKTATWPVATFGDLVLYGSGEVGKFNSAADGNYDRFPVAGVTARVERGTEMEKRVTATRVVSGGVMFGPAGAIIGALARKKKGGESWLTLESDDLFWSVEVDRGDEAKARKFAAEVNQAARS